ncbi:MAG: DUF1289 domain-containing protein [Pseudomonadales bacterium]|nr:DUF1289 domain-containing protein [Pseudomonadales bacterium]
MDKIKTPCIGICSTTSVGDPICRGCKRFAFEVINWNSYDEAAKQAVMQRIEQLSVQILRNCFIVVNRERLASALRQANIPFDVDRSPYYWLHNLLKKKHQELHDLGRSGVEIRPEYRQVEIQLLISQADQELLQLCEAHFDRYFALGEKLGELGEA